MAKASKHKDVNSLQRYILSWKANHTDIDWMDGPGLPIMGDSLTNENEDSDDWKIDSGMSDSCCTMNKEEAFLSGIRYSSELNAILSSDSYGLSSRSSIMPYVPTVREKNYAKAKSAKNFVTRRWFCSCSKEIFV